MATSGRRDDGLATAVALILFKRPDRTAQVFERIRDARPRRLFLIADGPRDEDPQESRDVEAARAMVERIDWDCEVTRDYAERNLGLKRRVPSGLDRVFEEVAEAIILEDDCLPDPTFFRYCDELLERYRADDRVVHIAGSRLASPAGDASYHFTRYVHIWGWATWRRAWRHYDVELADWHARSEAEREELLAAMFAEEAERRYWRYVWNESPRIENWDAQWSYVCLMRDACAINPNRNLVSNIGFGDDATNAIEDPFGIGGRPLEGVRFPLRHPREVKRDPGADAEASERFFRRDAPRPPEPGPLARLLRAVRGAS
jgi:hypothetical protein